MDAKVNDLVLFAAIASAKIIFMTKRDKAIIAYFNIDAKQFDNGLFCIILDNDPNEIYADGLTLAECDFALQDGWEDWEGAIPCRVSTANVWRLKYIHEQKRLKRVQCITDLRKVIAAGNVAKRLFKKNILQYSGKVDKFLSDYQF